MVASLVRSESSPSFSVVSMLLNFGQMNGLRLEGSGAFLCQDDVLLELIVVCYPRKLLSDIQLYYII